MLNTKLVSHRGVDLNKVTSWFPVVTTVRKYFEQYLEKPIAPAPEQLDAIEQLRHFFDCVVNGIAIAKRRGPVSLGIQGFESVSNHSIAMIVIGVGDTFIHARIKLYRATLSKMIRVEKLPDVKRDKFLRFIKEFERQATQP